MAKKVLSLVLALLLCVGSLPLRGLAAPPEVPDGEDGPVLVTFHEPAVTEVLPDGTEGEAEPLPGVPGDASRAPDPRSAPDAADSEARERNDDPEAPDPVKLSGQGEADQPRAG